MPDWTAPPPDFDDHPERAGRFGYEGTYRHDHVETLSPDGAEYEVLMRTGVRVIVRAASGHVLSGALVFYANSADDFPSLGYGPDAWVKFRRNPYRLP